MASTSRNSINSGFSTHGINIVSIIGAGVMGRGIAAVNLKAGFHVRLFDANETAAQAAVKQLQAAYADTSDSKQVHAPTISVIREKNEIADADLVIEAISEKAKDKIALFSELEAMLRPETLLVSNSSSLSITELASSLQVSNRFCGMHFCHPVTKRPLVEVIPGESTSPDMVLRILGYATSLGMSPISVRDSPGFLLNRLLVPFLNEALELLLERVDVETLDAAAADFGMPMGPLALLDEFGLDVAIEVGKTLFRSYPERIVPSGLLIALYKSGRRGCKSGRGFYVHTPDDFSAFDPDVTCMIQERYRDTPTPSAEDVARRLFLPMLLEATRTMEESLVANGHLIDTTLRDGLGMTDQYHGLFVWADAIGAETILEWLTPLEALGKRFEPTQPLLDVVAGRSVSLASWSAENSSGNSTTQN